MTRICSLSVFIRVNLWLIYLDILMTQPWEIEKFLEVQNGQLHIDRVSTVELAQQYGTPLFVFSESRIRHNIVRIKKAEKSIGCPLKICYAAKANSNMAILRTVKDAGSDIEVNSGGELWKALKIGFKPEQIIFNGTSKEVWEIEGAVNAGIYAIQVDSLYELSLIEETAGRLNKRANVSLRLVPEIETNTHSGLQTALLTSKFGMMPDEAFSAFRDFKDSPHLDLCGIHLHIGSQNPDSLVYTEALTLLFDFMLRIYSETGNKLKHINLGGGFPVNYSRGKHRPPDHIQKRIDEMVSEGVIRTEHRGQVTTRPVPKEILENYVRENMFEADYEPREAISHAWEAVRAKAVHLETVDIMDGLSLLIEPGRSIIADAGICLTTVRNLKNRPLKEINKELNKKVQIENAKQSRDVGIGFGISHIERGLANKCIDQETWLLTDAGFNILLSMETYKWYYHLISAERPGEAHDFPYKLAGPLCDGGDVYFDIEGSGRLPDHRLLPENVQPGEVLALLNCGAYSLAQASQYNGRFLPAVILIRENGEIVLARKRDTNEDLVANEIF